MTLTQMKQLVRCGAISTLVLGACAADPADPATSRSESAVTIDDIDLAPECAGILTYVNGASFGELDSYLPSDVAAAIDAAQPFGNIEALSSVSGVAQARIALIAARARTLGQIGPSCAGVYEELA